MRQGGPESKQDALITYLLGRHSRPEGTLNQDLEARLRAWGVHPGYEGYKGRWTDPPASTLEAILGALGEGAAPPPPPVIVVREGEHLDLGGDTQVVLEEGVTLTRREADETQLPFGYHSSIDERTGDVRRLIVAPRRCFLPADLWVWGWAVQLYSLKSRSGWGMGDLDALRTFARWSRKAGAGMMLVNPLHAASPGTPQENSPYYPSSRTFRNMLYLDVTSVPGFDEIDERDRFVSWGAEVNLSPRIDRDAVYGLKLEALEACWQHVGPVPEGPNEPKRGGPLRSFATFVTIAEQQGPDWHAWPQDLQHPDSVAVAKFSRENDERVRFHMWIQGLLDRQLEAASSGSPLVHDLAIGVEPGGADAWLWQECIAQDISVGAPADEFNANGQDWGVAAFDPWRLQAKAYEPFAQTIRSAMRHAGGIRFDHVMGLFRLFWIPDGVAPSEGAYVRYPSEDLLAILALESHKAQAYVVGEDLGTVEPYVREEMGKRGMLSYKLLWFEDGDPRGFPRESLAAATSHDLPTTAGLWSGADLAFQEAQGLGADEESAAGLIDRISRHTGCPVDSPVADVIERTYEVVARAGSSIATVTLEDGLQVEERQNYPGTSGDWNWTLRLSPSVEEIVEDERVERLAEVMNEGRSKA